MGVRTSFSFHWGRGVQISTALLPRPPGPFFTSMAIIRIWLTGPAGLYGLVAEAAATGRRQIAMTRFDNAYASGAAATRFGHLFHPRLDRWSDHFRISGGIIEPLTPEGDITARLPRFNQAQRVVERKLLQTTGLYPRM